MYMVNIASTFRTHKILITNYVIHVVSWQSTPTVNAFAWKIYTPLHDFS